MLSSISSGRSGAKSHKRRRIAPVGCKVPSVRGDVAVSLLIGKRANQNQKKCLIFASGLVRSMESMVVKRALALWISVTDEGKNKVF